MKLTRDVKNILKSLIEKQLKKDAAKTKKVPVESFNQSQTRKQVEAFCSAVSQNPSAYLDFEYQIEEGEGIDSHYNDNINLSKEALKLIKKLNKQFPIASDEDDCGNRVHFTALEFTLEVPNSLKRKYQALSDKIDLAVVTGDNQDLYDLVKQS